MYLNTQLSENLESNTHESRPELSISASCLLSVRLPQNEKRLVPDFKIETVTTLEKIYEGDIRNEHFGLMRITALSNMCGLAGVSE
jgi:hypothetical protein